MPKTGSARSPSLTSQESYSAIIIADLVAEVQQQPESDKKVLSKVKEESNLDDSDCKTSDRSADVDQIEVKINGTNISKGVILNAGQFGQPDGKSKTVSTLPLQETDEVEQEKDKPPNLKLSEMSALRKIAFGFSFIPSIMFVLCFAVIFPCIKVVPCAKEIWSITLNHTEVTSKLKVGQNVFFTFQTDAEPGLRSVNKASGETVWNSFTTSPLLYTDCGNLVEHDSASCLVMDNNGTLSLFDQLNGKKLGQLNCCEDQMNSFPIILPNCENDGTEKVAVAVSSSAMKIISLETESFVDIPDCESLPANLLKWKKKNGTDLLLTCKKGKNDILLRIPQNKWCKYNNTTLEKISILISKKAGVLSNSKLFPSEDGLAIWSENEVTLLDIEGHMKWTVSALNHTIKNRFLLHGKLNKEEVILYSSDLEKYFQVTMLDFENGDVTLSKTIPNIEISELVLIHGEKYDFALSLRKKLVKSFKSEAGEQINKISASVMNLLTKEESSVNWNGTSKIVEELILMQLDGKEIQTLQTFNYLEGQNYSTLFTVLKENEDLDIYVLRQARDLKHTTLKRISTSNWDISSTQCTSK